MKNFFAIMATASILSASCAQEETTPEQESGVNVPTTFSFLLEEETDVCDNACSAYFDEEGKCRLIAEHGNLVPHVETDTVTMKEFHSHIYLFYSGSMRLTAEFVPVKGRHTTFVLSLEAQGKKGSTGIVVSEKNEYTWPH
jgi:hypothetical protein